MARLPHVFLTPIAAAAWLAAGGANAQMNAQMNAQPTAPQQLEPVTVTGRMRPPLDIGGWGDTRLDKTPMQATVITAERMKDYGVARLADLVGFDPAVSDAYNTEGYWDYLTVRGYVLDNKYNFRRDGLPINAETRIELDNKSRVEILKGTSGIQVGTSAPGGIVNYVVKRPLDAPLRSVSLDWRQAGSVTGSVDLSQRFGEGQAFGVRLNAVAAHIDPLVHDAQGNRNLFALAGDWRINPGSVLEAEVETSHRSQPSVPAFSMLGDKVPAPGDPRINLNNQPWSLPVVFDSTTASLRWRQRLSADWQFTAHIATQQLRTDDRIAFPFGCSDPNPPPNGTYFADRYCPNGNFDMYDFRSEDERRRTDVIDLSVQGKLRTGALTHALTTGVMRSAVHNRFQQQAYNYVGTGNVDGSAVNPADPTLTSENTNRDERSTELYLRDVIAVTDRFTAWLGLRYTRLARQSAQTDGSTPTDYSQSFTTPWLAASYAFAPDQMVYASWGQGVESEVVANRGRYTNAGQALPALKSHQTEIGLKGSTERFEWGLAWFDIDRPQSADLGACDVANSCTRATDGTAHHQGIEASGGIRDGAWTLHAGTQWLHARREGSQTTSINGMEPTNVPAVTLKLDAAYAVAAMPGLTLRGKVAYEGPREVLPDNSASIPGFTRADVGLRYDARIANVAWIWRVGVDNVFDKRAWRESPYQFGHVYLFPQAPRTAWASVQVDL